MSRLGRVGLRGALDSGESSYDEFGHDNFPFSVGREFVTLTAVDPYTRYPAIRSRRAALMRRFEIILGSSAKTIGLVGLMLAVAAAVPTAVSAQVVQLPTFDSFTVNTSVLVPDGGTAVIGGSSSSAWSSRMNGVPGASRVPGAGRLFGNRAIGGSTSSSTVTVRAQIHDFAAMDDALLAQDRKRVTTTAARSAPKSAVDRKAEYITRNIGRRD